MRWLGMSKHFGPVRCDNLICVAAPSLGASLRCCPSFRISRRCYRRGVAQPGRAPGSGPGGRRFKSSLPDQSFQSFGADGRDSAISFFSLIFSLCPKLCRRISIAAALKAIEIACLPTAADGLQLEDCTAALVAVPAPPTAVGRSVNDATCTNDRTRSRSPSPLGERINDALCPNASIRVCHVPVAGAPLRPGEPARN